MGTGPRHNRHVPHSDAPNVVIVTGMSGAGRSTTSWALDDLGWYVIDNLPSKLLELAVDHVAASEGTSRVAIIADVRAGQFFEDFEKSVEQLRASGAQVTVLFLDAADDVLVRRFEYTRRPHPLHGGGTLLAAVSAERELMADVRAVADVVVDTGPLNPHELRQRIGELFAAEQQEMHLNIQSFGFKFGLPMDADLVFDVRFLPNPHWVEALRDKTGQDSGVSDYVLASPDAVAFLESAERMLLTALPGFEREGKRFVSIAIGCTGGKHRSVAIAEDLSHRLNGQGFANRVTHRDAAK